MRTQYAAEAAAQAQAGGPDLAHVVVLVLARPAGQAGRGAGALVSEGERFGYK